MAETLRHRQTKEAATDMFSLQPPRHIPTLPKARITAFQQQRQLHPDQQTLDRGRNLDCESIAERYFPEIVEATRGASMARVHVGTKGNSECSCGKGLRS